MSLEELLAWFLVSAAHDRARELLFANRPSLAAMYLADHLWREAASRFGITGE